jgi:glycosyltransferase involved in cell wall biosynthesis
MRQQGYEVVVGTRVEQEGMSSNFDPGVEVINMPFVRQPSFFHDLRALISTIRLIRSVRPRIVNASTPKAGFLGIVAARLCQVPNRVYVVRGLRFETAKGIQRLVLIFSERLTMKLATEVIFNGPSSRLIAERHGLIEPNRGIVIGSGSGNGIDRSRFKNLTTRDEARAALNIERDIPVIGFVGRLTNAKGVADLVAAFEIVKQRLPQTVLIMVGDYESGDPVDEYTQRAIKDCGEIICIPHTDDVATFYSAIDLLVFPSYREGLPNVVLETQLCGKPVVAYRSTGTVDAVVNGETGVMVEIGDVSALASETVRLIEDPSLRIKMGEKGRSWVESEFDPERIWEGLNHIYQRGSYR